MARTHHYTAAVRWTGNLGAGTSTDRSYERTHEISAADKPAIAGSADLAFRGNADHWNPEELLVVSLAQCHLLWYLHLAAVSGVVVTGYTDEPLGTVRERRDGSGEFTDVLLRLRVIVAESAMVDLAEVLHDRAHATCFVARSVNFPAPHRPSPTSDHEGSSSSAAHPRDHFSSGCRLATRRSPVVVRRYPAPV